jgi:hypothetical protein
MIADITVNVVRSACRRFQCAFVRARFQYGDLAGVVKAVLHDAMKEAVEIVVASRHNFAKSRVVERFDRIGESLTGLEKMSLRGEPFVLTAGERLHSVGI